MPAVLPPQPKEEHPHEDWVSALAALPGSSSAKGGRDGGEPLLASGCYDGIVRLWRGGGEVCSWAAHKGPVQAATAVASAAGEGPLLLTAGNDNVALLWRGLAAAARGGGAPEAAAVLKGHGDTIQGAAAAPDGNLCCTGGWDSRLLVWRCGDALLAAAEAGEEAGENGKAGGTKRRKVGANGAAAAQHVEAPRAELSGHSQCVAGVAWPAAGEPPGRLSRWTGGREHGRGCLQLALQPAARRGTLQVAARMLLCVCAIHARCSCPCPAGQDLGACLPHFGCAWPSHTPHAVPLVERAV